MGKVLKRVTQSSERERAESVQQPLRETVRKREYEAMREAYLRQADTAHDADDWANADEWKT